MFHYTYIISHDNGKYYVGRHSTEKLDDRYMGSGKWTESVKTKSHLKKDIITFFDTFENLKVAEQKLLDEHVGYENCMNFNNRSVGFGTGNLNPARSPEERKRRSEHSWTKTAAGRKYISDNNPSKLDHVKEIRRVDCYKNEKFVANILKANDPNHRSKSEKHRNKMRVDNPAFRDDVKIKLSDSAKLQHKIGNWRLQDKDIREKAVQSLRNSTKNKNKFKDPTILAKLQKPKNVVQCPHCLKSGGTGSMSRWHFDKCNKRIFSVNGNI